VKVGLEIYNNGSILPYWGAQDFVPIPLSHIIGILTAFLFYFVTQIQESYKFGDLCDLFFYYKED
jgi:ammonia channel protein AmtB